MNLLQSYVLSGGARGGKLTKLDGLATGQWKAPREPLEGLLCPTFDIPAIYFFGFTKLFAAMLVV